MAYRVAALILIVLGLLAILSIGPLLLLVGLVMLVLGPVRGRPVVFWPPLIGVLAFIGGYLVVAPWYCHATSTPGAISSTVCSSLAGIRYAGGGNYNPSLVPAVIAGLVVGGVSAVVALLILLRRSRRTPVSGR